MTQVSRGDRVQIHYTGRFPDGTIFDTSEEREPLEFTAGSHEVIQGVSEAVIGMEVGEQKTVTIPPERAYGHHDPAMQQSIPLADLPEGIEEGEQLRAEQDGQEISVWVREIADENAVLDANHPLAGQTLVFDLEVVSFKPADT